MVEAAPAAEPADVDAPEGAPTDMVDAAPEPNMVEAAQEGGPIRTETGGYPQKLALGPPKLRGEVAGEEHDSRARLVSTPVGLAESDVPVPDDFEV